MVHTSCNTFDVSSVACVMAFYDAMRFYHTPGPQANYYIAHALVASAYTWPLQAAHDPLPSITHFIATHISTTNIQSAVP